MVESVGKLLTTLLKS